jgi:fibronectin-binding autotransporter adhesin
MKPRPNPLLHISAALALGIVGSAQASSYTWNSNGGPAYNGNWTDTSADGWNGGTPVSGDTALIDNGTVSATANNQQAGVALTIGSTGVLNDGGNYLYFSGGSLTLNSGAINVSFQGDGTYRSGGLGATVTANSGTSSINNNGANQGLALENGGTTFTGAGNLNLGLGLFDNWADGTGDGIIKSGTGTLTMTANSNYSGATTVSGGVLDLSSGIIYQNAGWASRSITINNGGAVKVSNWGDGNADTAGGFGQIGFGAGNIVLDNGTLEYVGGAASGNMDRSFTIGAGGATLVANGSATWEITEVGRGIALASNGGTLTLSGSSDGLISKAIGGNGGLTKTGAGTWTLSGVNSFTGQTTVNSGTLVLGAYYSLASSSGLTINNGGTVSLENFNPIGDSSVTPVTINSGGLMTMSGNYSVNIGSLTLNGGELSSGGFFDATYGSYYLRNDVTVGTGTSTISAVKITGNGVRSFDVASGGTLNVTGNFSSLYGSFGLTKTGSGTMTLSGSNDYTGATTVSAGKLKVTGSIASSDVTVNGGVLASGSTGTVGKSVTVNTGATFAAGDVGTVGAATVANDLSFSSGSIFDWDLTTATYTYDTVSVAGALTIASGAKFNVVSSTGFNDTFWDATHTWSNIFGGKDIDNFLVSNFLYSGSNIAPSAEGYFTVSGTDLTWTAVPEPTSALAGLLIAAGLLRRRR